MIKPHTLFLHSALVASRNIGSNRKQKNINEKAYFYFKIDSAFAFSIAMIINTSIAAIFAKGNICDNKTKKISHDFLYNFLL